MASDDDGRLPKYRRAVYYGSSRKTLLRLLWLAEHGEVRSIKVRKGSADLSGSGHVDEGDLVEGVGGHVVEGGDYFEALAEGAPHEEEPETYQYKRPPKKTKPGPKKILPPGRYTKEEWERKKGKERARRYREAQRAKKLGALLDAGQYDEAKAFQQRSDRARRDHERRSKKRKEKVTRDDDR